MVFGINTYRRHKKRRPQGRYAHLRFSLPERVGITQRPVEAEQRLCIGDWEGDAVHGKQRRDSLATHTDRKSRLLTWGRTHDRSAHSFREATERALGWVPTSLRKTLTLDNGTEMAKHQQIAKTLGLKTFFADPYSPWQRGTNEQINGLIRRYFPKGTDFISKVSNQRLDEGVLKINQRPRKCLGYWTPYNVFADAQRVPPRPLPHLPQSRTRPGTACRWPNHFRSICLYSERQTSRCGGRYLRLPGRRPGYYRIRLRQYDYQWQTGCYCWQRHRAWWCGG